MEKHTISPIPEFKGAESYPDAVDSLLENRKQIGAVVMRHIFDAETIDITKKDIPKALIFNDANVLAEGDARVSRWWDEHGYDATHINPPSWSGLKSRNGFRIAQSTINQIILSYASLQGVQHAYVSPGIDRQPDVKLPDQHALKIQRMLGNDSNAPAYDRIFDYHAALTPGDVVLTVAAPSPAYFVLRAEADASLYTGFSHDIAKGYSVDRVRTDMSARLSALMQ